MSRGRIETRALQQAEGAAIAAAALLLYGQAGAGWWLFAALILAPDLAMLGYLAGPRTGARVYNAAHVYLAPALLWAAGLAGGWPLLTPLALIWTAHIGIDRALGYGLKHAAGFRHTHLGPIGPARPARKEAAR